MRSLGFALAVLSLLGGGSASCFAQITSGPSSLENLVTDESTSSDAQDAAAISAPRQGVLARPTDQALHADLEKAWRDYEAIVSKITYDVQTAIQQQFDAAAAKGDLDSAELWQKSLDDFAKQGLLPTGEATKAVVDEARTVLAKAKQDLGDGYTAVIKALTMSKDISLAKAVREEWRLLESTWQKIAPQLPQGTEPAKEPKQGGQHLVDKDGKWVVLFRSRNPAHWDRQIDANGSYAIPLNEAPAGVRFLRLTRESNERYVIVGITKEQLANDGPLNDTYGWVGTGFHNWNAHHLGIYKLDARTSKGQITIMHLGGARSGRSGWGFGHRCGVDDRQGCSWAGQEILPSTFEIAVKCGDLTEAEKKHLLSE